LYDPDGGRRRLAMLDGRQLPLDYWLNQADYNARLSRLSAIAQSPLKALFGTLYNGSKTVDT